MKSRPYFGSIGKCLEDEYELIKSTAIVAFVKSVTNSDDTNAKEVMTTINQLENDTSSLVRTAVIKCLHQTFTIVGHFVQLDDSQLRLILQIIVDEEFHQHAQIEVLKFLEHLYITSYDQMKRISDDFSKAANKCDFEALIIRAYTFGRHNSCFARILSSDIFGTL